MNLTDVLHLPLSTAMFYALPFLVALTVIVFFAHLALRWLSNWIERVAPPEDRGPH